MCIVSIFQATIRLYTSEQSDGVYHGIVMVLDHSFLSTLGVEPLQCMRNRVQGMASTMLSCAACSFHVDCVDRGCRSPLPFVAGILARTAALQATGSRAARANSAAHGLLTVPLAFISIGCNWSNKRLLHDERPTSSRVNVVARRPFSHSYRSCGIRRPRFMHRRSSFGPV